MQQPRPIVVVAGQRRPHELLLLVVGLVTAIGYVAGGTPPNSVAAVLPLWAVATFYFLLGFGSAIGLLGCVISRSEYGPGLEQAGLLFQGAALALYAVVVQVYAGWRGWGFLIILGGWLVANLWRAWQIQDNLRAVRRAGER